MEVYMTGREEVQKMQYEAKMAMWAMNAELLKAREGTQFVPHMVSGSNSYRYKGARVVGECHLLKRLDREV
jgi:hypothetical protein